MGILFPQTPDPGSLTMTSPPPSVLTALSGRRKLQGGSPLGRGLDRNWQASDVGPSACPGPNTEEWATQDAATHPTTSMPQPLPAPGMSFAYNIPCLLPSEEGPSVSEPPVPVSPGCGAHGTLWSTSF